MDSVRESPLLSKIHQEIKQAYEKAKLESDIDGDVVLLTEDRYQDAMEFLRIHYMTDEPCSRAGNQEFSAEFQHHCLLVPVSFGLSVMVLKPGTSDIIAIMVIDIERRGDVFIVDGLTDEAYKKTNTIQNRVVEAIDIFEQFGIAELLRFEHLSVDRRYRQNGLATKLIKFCLKLFQNMSISPLYAKVHCSSMYSKRVFEKNGFKAVYKINYAEYFEDGQLVFPNMGEHTSFVFLVRKIV